MARAGLGWTLRDLAKRAQVNPNTISRYETGKDIMAGTLRKIEAALQAGGVTFIDEAGTIGVTFAWQQSNKST
jgi:transcriptional regulator with XRE-family HTH domain